MAQGYAVGNPNAGVQQLSCGGRLTLTSGTPVTTSDVTAATNVYFTPYLSGYISLYNSTLQVWQSWPFSEITIAVPASTSQMYDVFAYISSGAVACEVVAWTNDTTRATALALQNGVYVKSGSTDRRYIGSFRTTTVSGQTEDSYGKRLVYNYNNRVIKSVGVNDSTGSWTYSTATWRYARNQSTNRVEVVVGVVEDQATVNGTVIWSEGGAGLLTAVPGIGINANNANSATINATRSGSSGTDACTCFFGWTGFLAAGFNYIAWLEYGAGSSTQTWYGGAAGNAGRSSGITGFVRL